MSEGAGRPEQKADGMVPIIPASGPMSKPVIPPTWVRLPNEAGAGNMSGDTPITGKAATIRALSEGRAARVRYTDSDGAPADATVIGYNLVAQSLICTGDNGNFEIPFSVITEAGEDG